MAHITIRIRPNGPLLLEASGPWEGIVQMVDHQGNAYTLPAAKPVVALCRCGHSAIKPFCDGAHKTCGFQADELAPPPPG